MTDKWQCCMCKATKTKTIVLIETESGIKIMSDEDRAEMKCCFRLMRNLSESVYIKESSINDSGARG